MVTAMKMIPVMARMRRFFTVLLFSGYLFIVPGWLWAFFFFFFFFLGLRLAIGRIVCIFVANQLLPVGL